MGKFFWPIYIIVATLLLTATWAFAPAIGEKLPQGARDSIRKMMGNDSGKGENPPGSNANAEGAAKSASGEKGPSGNRAGAPKRVPSPPAAKQPAAANGERVAPKPTAASGGPSAAKPQTAQEEEEEDPPFLKGIMQENPARAKWGVLNQVTTVESLDGETKGAVAGGRIFLIESRERHGSKYWLIGNFSPKPMDEKVRIPSTCLNCFSGNPDVLSPKQRDCLKMFYQLRGEALKRKEQVLRENADKSPYGHQAAAAKRAFDEKAREVEESSRGDNPKAKNELSQLREKYTALLEKHRAWKKENESKLKDPEKDPEYLKKLQEARKYEKPIAGMAF